MELPMNKMLNTITVALLCVSYGHSRDIKIETTIQPLLQLKEKGDFSRDGESELGFNRARLGFTYGESINSLSIKSKLSVDFTEDTFDEIVKNGYIGVEVIPEFGFTVGRFKGVFGYENRVSSKKLPLVFRSETSSHLKKELGISGFLDGVRFSGTLQKLPLTYVTSNTKSSPDNNARAHIDRLPTQPAFSVDYTRFDSVKI